MNIPSKLKIIEQKSRQLGFAGFGVAPAAPGAAAVKYFHEWLDARHDGEMAYMRRRAAERVDLDKVLPGVRSVICLRTDYPTMARDMGFLDATDVGDISLYALNADYHDIISPRLQALEQALRAEFPGCRTRAYVDTGPILEKPLAQKAGLGWIGKHTNLITESVGSWYFLSEVLTDIELPVSTESPDRCGICRSCIDICPTRAIVAPYVLDSRRCISYLTIELKGVIPVEFRKAIGNRIYGCDDCQIVCPWNSFARLADEPEFRGQAVSRRLTDLIRLDEAGFRQMFARSPIKRIKRKGFLRNVAVALGNSGDPEAIPALTAALQDGEPLIRAHAAWALGELMGEGVRAVFKNHLAGERDEIVCSEMARLKTRYNKP